MNKIEKFSAALFCVFSELSQSALNQIINNDQTTTKAFISLENTDNNANSGVSSDLRPFTNHNTFNFQSLTNLSQRNHNAKMIVNLTKSNPTTTTTSIDINGEQTIVHLQSQQNSSPVREFLNPLVNVIQQQPAILHIPCSLTAPNIEAAPIVGTFIEPDSSTSQQHQQQQNKDSTPPPPIATAVVEILAPRKRRINEFDSLSKLEDKLNDDEAQPSSKLTRLNDSTSKFKTTLKKSKETLKSVDNLENSDLNVNKSSSKMLDDEAVKVLSNGT